MGNTGAEGPCATQLPSPSKNLTVTLMCPFFFLIMVDMNGFLGRNLFNFCFFYW